MSAITLLAMPLAAATAPSPFASGRSTFTVLIDDEVLDYDTMAVTCLPGATLRLTVPLAGESEQFDLLVEGGERPKPRDEPRSWEWRAPDAPGMSEIHVVRHTTHEAMRIRVFALTPANEIVDGQLNGYAMGAYPAKPLRGLKNYLPPAGFIEVTRQNQDLEVSPHFKLRQFLCKQAGGDPRYLLVTPRLLRLLERVLEQLNEAGKRSDTLFVMSGFRTPLYNAALRDTANSRHQWGDAADVYPDADGDGRIDDLNGDGKSNDLDAEALADLVERMFQDKDLAPFIGGLGRYGESRTHPPFVHLDTRGYRARWKE